MIARPKPSFDDVANNPSWLPRWGWHDDHRDQDGTAEYLPAIEQVRSEFLELAAIIEAELPRPRHALQLGIGKTDASHNLWRVLFDSVVSIDARVIAIDMERRGGADTRHTLARDTAYDWRPFNFLFIDAGHTYADVAADHLVYGAMVRDGGIIAFHDALRRYAYPTIEVWKYLETLGEGLQMIGDEVGVAVLRK